MHGLYFEVFWTSELFFIIYQNNISSENGALSTHVGEIQFYFDCDSYWKNEKYPFEEDREIMISMNISKFLVLS